MTKTDAVSIAVLRTADGARGEVSSMVSFYVVVDGAGSAPAGLLFLKINAQLTELYCPVLAIYRMLP